MLSGRELFAREEANTKDNPTFRPFDSGIVRGDGPGQAISVDVTGVRRLRLLTTCTEGVGNLGIWVASVAPIATDGMRSISARSDRLIRVGWGSLESTRTGRTSRCASASTNQARPVGTRRQRPVLRARRQVPAPRSVDWQGPSHRRWAVSDHRGRKRSRSPVVAGPGEGFPHANQVADSLTWVPAARSSGSTRTRTRPRMRPMCERRRINSVRSRRSCGGS